MLRKNHKRPRQNEHPPISEEVLLTRLRADQTEAYKYFFWEYCDYINRLTFSLVDDKEDARTVMLGIMSDVWANRHIDWLQLPLKPFLYQEVYRRSLPYLNEKKKSLLARHTFHQ